MASKGNPKISPESERGAKKPKGGKFFFHILAAVVVIVLIACVVVFLVMGEWWAPVTPPVDEPQTIMSKEQVYAYVNAEIENCLNNTLPGFPRLDYNCFSFASDNAGYCDYAEDPEDCYSTYYIFKSVSKNEDLCGNIADSTGRTTCEVIFSANADRCDELDGLAKTHPSFSSAVCKAVINNDPGLCDPGSDGYERCINGIHYYYSAKNHDTGECAGVMEEAIDESNLRNERLCKVFASGDESLCGYDTETILLECKMQISYELFAVEDPDACILIDEQPMREDCSEKVKS